MTVPIRIKTLLAAAAVLVLTACGSSATAPSPASVDASIQSGGFTPGTISISMGSTVTWTNQDNTTHAVVADNGAFASGAIPPGGKYSYMFPSAGTFTYHDTSNPNMRGTVTVSGSTSMGY